MAKHTVYIEESLDSDVEEYREQEGKSRSEVVRNALRDYLAERGEQ